MKLRNYRLLIFLIAVGIITIFSFPAMATDVGGIFYSDTTWDLAGSPYNITSDVQIAEGVTLTIEPGVVVNGGTIIPWGILNAIGNSTNKISLNNVTIIQLSSYAVNSSVNISFANISGGIPARQFIASVSILDSKMQNCGEIRIVGSLSGSVYIERNIFLSSAGLYFSAHGDVYVKNNVFYQQSGGFAVYNNSNTDDIVVTYNSFLSNDRVALEIGGVGNMIATENFWNTTDTAVIDSMIYDRNDDLNVANYIEYIPFLTEQHPDTPPLDENQAPTSNSGDDQAVHDQVTLNGTGSFDPDGSIVSYDWSLQHRTNSANDRTASGDNPTVYNLSPGFYDVYLTVTDDGGLVDTDNMLLAVAGSCFCTPSTFHIELIEPDLLKADKGEKHGQALVKVMDDCSNAVSGATVYGTFSGDISESINGQTGGDGNVLLTTTVSTKSKPSFTFCVDDVINGTLSYAPADNVETCDSYK